MGPFSSSISIASGKSIVLLIICLPQLQFLKTPPSLHLPGAPMSTKVKQYDASQTAKRIILWVPL